jgi:sugar lactone lactonase YvrE
MKSLTHFKKTRTLSFLIFLNLGVVFALVSSAHAQNLYVSVNGAVCGMNCSDFTGSIYEYTPDGMQSTFADSLARPRGLTFDSSGNLVVGVNYFAPPPEWQGKILRLRTQGHQRGLGNVLQGVLEGIVRDSVGNTFTLAQSAFAVVDKSNIYKFAPDRTRTLFGSVPNVGGFDLVLDSAGNLYAADADDQTIYKFAPDRTRTIFVGPSAFTPSAGPIGFAFDGAGNLFVSTEGDPGNDTILEFTPDGTESTFATGLNNPRGLAFDGLGNLFVAESNAAPDGDILKFAPEGGAPTVFASGIDSPEFLTFGPPL